MTDRLAVPFRFSCTNAVWDLPFRRADMNIEVECHELSFLH